MTKQLNLTGDRASLAPGPTLSAHVAGNAEVFPQVLDLHVESGSKIADVTYGKGVFWKNVPNAAFDVHGTDIDPEKSPTDEAVDCRDLPYPDGSFDCVVLDPPYAEGYFRRNAASLAGQSSHKPFRDAYSTGDSTDATHSKYHEAVLDLYFAAGAEARRVLHDDGTLIVKVQDEVSSNTQELTHIQITNRYADLGFHAKDLFVVIRSNRPSVNGLDKQVHARKNHSYFMVYEHE
jgi:DNA modification methylase